jgi:hypothetical protein
MSVQQSQFAIESQYQTHSSVTQGLPNGYEASRGKTRHADERHAFGQHCAGIRESLQPVGARGIELQGTGEFRNALPRRSQNSPAKVNSASVSLLRAA